MVSLLKVEICFFNLLILALYIRDNYPHPLKRVSCLYTIIRDEVLSDMSF